MVPDALSGGPHFAAFCERYVRQTKGRWAGRPLALEGWEREFWWEALELDPTTGLRIYSEAGLGIPTKNGKSTQAAACGLYFLVADGEPEPEVYVGAAKQQQAGIVLSQSRTMVERSAALRGLVVPHRYRIDCPRNNGIMRAVASDGPLQHGLNPSCNIIDEIHAHRDGGLYTALTKSGAAREQPFTLWISTAGKNDQGILAELYGQMFSGPGELERRGGLLIYRDRANGVLVYWYGADRDADIDDPAVWTSCNPASWLADGVYLRREHERLRARGAIPEWRMYHLNQFAGIENAWLPIETWASLVDPAMTLDPALPVGAGVFKTTHSDGAAVVVAQKQGERVVLRARIFPVEASTGRVSSVAMRQHLREIAATYPLPQAIDEKTRRALPGPAIAFEPWSFAESAAELEADGLNMVEMAQNAGTMGPASTRAYELATTGRLAHDGDPVLAAHVGFTRARLSDRGMVVVPERIDEQRPNHAAVAAVMAIAMASLPPPPPPKPRLYGSFS